MSATAWSYYPGSALLQSRFGLFPVRSPLLGESLSCFLLLQVLRCFSSLRSPPYPGTDDRPSGGRVVPFGNPRIKGYLLLPAAYRSLSRPSSPPRAKASTRRPNLLSPFGALACAGSYFLLLKARHEPSKGEADHFALCVCLAKSLLYSLVCQYVKDLGRCAISHMPNDKYQMTDDM